MRFAPGIVLVILFAPAGLAGAAPGGADADWAAFQAVVQETPPEAQQQKAAVEQHFWTAEHARRIREAGLRFFQAHPHDARRWAVVEILLNTRHLFLTQSREEYLREPAGEYPQTDDAAWAAWDKQLSVMTARLMIAPDAPASARRAVVQKRVQRSVYPAWDGELSREQMLSVQTDLTALLEQSPTELLIKVQGIYLMALAKHLPDEYPSILKELATSEHPQVRELIEGKLRVAAYGATPLELDFTAVDGRKVSLAGLRGKVVLIDFWATWCGPCIRELPHVKAAYAKYHAEGFEVIGIALEDAGLQADDTDAQREKKLEAAQSKLVRFAQREQLPWPQYFNARRTDSEVARRYAITAIPVMFLLDREGRVVSTTVRGEGLEREVERLFGS